MRLYSNAAVCRNSPAVNEIHAGINKLQEVLVIGDWTLLPGDQVPVPAFWACIPTGIQTTHAVSACFIKKKVRCEKGFMLLIRNNKRAGVAQEWKKQGNVC
jgi:hypothetical protein